MKAIIVLDLEDENEEVIKTELRADVRLDVYGEEYFVFRNIGLKPLPEKKYCDYEIDFDEDFEFARGYNQCLFEITGEERYVE